MRSSLFSSGFEFQNRITESGSEILELVNYSRTKMLELNDGKKLKDGEKETVKDQKFYLLIFSDLLTELMN